MMAINTVLPKVILVVMGDDSTLAGTCDVGVAGGLVVIRLVLLSFRNAVRAAMSLLSIAGIRFVFSHEVIHASFLQ